MAFIWMHLFGLKLKINTDLKIKSRQLILVVIRRQKTCGDANYNYIW